MKHISITSRSGQKMEMREAKGSNSRIGLGLKGGVGIKPEWFLFSLSFVCGAYIDI
jgi:hypothetical protein